jgi:hypothetical protein
MKTELVAKWVIVDGHLEAQWLEKDSNRVVQMNRPVPELAKAA